MELARSIVEGEEVLVFGNDVTGVHRHVLPLAVAGTEGTETVNWVENAYKELLEQLDVRTSIARDTRLSEFGKAERLEPLNVRIIENPAKLAAALDGYEREHITRFEASLLATQPPAPANVVAGIRATEIRQWARQQKMGDLLRRETMTAEVVAALMDSPIPWATDEQLKAFRQLWEARQRDEKPEQFAVLDARRAAVDRARRANAQIVAVADTVVRWPRDKVLRTLIQSTNEYAQRGFGAFNLTKQQAAAARLTIR